MNQQLALQYRSMRLAARQREIADRTEQIKAVSIHDMIDDVLTARFGRDGRVAPRLLRQSFVARNVGQIVFIDPTTIGRHKVDDILSDSGTCDSIRGYIHLDVRSFKRMPDGSFRPGFIVPYVDLSKFAAAGPGIAAPGAKALPQMAELDFIKNRPEGDYMVGLGVGQDGEVWENLQSLVHIKIGGSTRSGKSSFCRAFVYQLAQLSEHGQPIELYLCDMEDKTFSWAVNWPIVKSGIAKTVEEAEIITDLLMIEMERRSKLYNATGKYPETWEEYREASGQTLPWIVAMFEEASSLVEEAGQRSQLVHNIRQLSKRSAKYGMTLVMVGQDFKADLFNTSITNQFETCIAFRCETPEQAWNILRVRDVGAEHIVQRGRCVMKLHGRCRQVQSFWVPKEVVVGGVKGADNSELGMERMGREEGRGDRAPTADGERITEDEASLVFYAVHDLEGEFIVNKIAAEYHGDGWTSHRVKLLAQEWEKRGWLTHPASAAAARRVTARLCELAGIDFEGAQGNAQGVAQAAQGSGPGAYEALFKPRMAAA